MFNGGPFAPFASPMPKKKDDYALNGCYNDSISGEM